MAGEKSPDGGHGSLAVDAGLCADCVHRRLQRGGRSVFVRCALARIDPAFARYPRLPVVRCDGHSRAGPSAPSDAGTPFS